MGRKNGFMDRLAGEYGLPASAEPMLPIVEIAGEGRVLVENHFGVMEYSAERISVKVTYGHLSVCGCHLELMRMTKDQLVIAGRIDSVSLHRRNRL